MTAAATRATRLGGMKREGAWGGSVVVLVMIGVNLTGSPHHSSVVQRHRDRAAGRAWWSRRRRSPDHSGHGPSLGLVRRSVALEEACPQRVATAARVRTPPAAAGHRLEIEPSAGGVRPTVLTC
jgi:hypothetical protein